MSYWGYKPYVPVAQRRANAAKQVKLLLKKGQKVSPVVIEGRRIVASFWGKAWCENLERYSDYANRLPRGRTYVRNGSVVDLSIAEGSVKALVSGSQIYEVCIDIAPAAAKRWHKICADCTGSIGSIVELLQGKLAKQVMERVCREGDGLFPGPREITMTCTCPDWAGMCKHVAAALYGVGARFDVDPDALFTLRGVDRNELIALDVDTPMTERAATNERVLADDDMAALFGIELEAPLLLASTAPGQKKLPKAISEKRSTRKSGVTGKMQAVGEDLKSPRGVTTAGKQARAPLSQDAPLLVARSALSQSAKPLVQDHEEAGADTGNVDRKASRVTARGSASRLREQFVRLSERKKRTEESQGRGSGRRR